MDESIQRWCNSSVAPSAAQSRSDRGKPKSNVGQLVEIAAFLKLIESRGLADVKTFEGLGLDPILIDEQLRPLINSCPLAANSPPEVLGSIHEYLVSRREDSRAGSSRRSSTSRKTNGIFYTPQPVIDYILGQTLGRRLECATPEQIAELTILDPAAGCGAFLVSAYRYLMGWHLNWYLANEPDQWPDALVQTPRGWQLTAKRCQTILINNVYGVDLDAVAISVAQRILWLTLIDSSPESERTALSGLGQVHRPSNFQQGHALIGAAFDEDPPVDAGSASQYRFDWTDAFPQVAAQGGFDFVIGNPPYRREKDFKRELDEISATTLGRFRSPRMDLWYYFVHRGIQLLRAGGGLSFITNAYWLNGTGAEKLISTLRDEVHLDELFHLQNQPLFPGVSGQHLIFRLTKSADETPTTIKIAPREAASSVVTLFSDMTAVRNFSKSRQQLFRENRVDLWPDSDRLLDKLNCHPRLNELGIVRQGIAENPSTVNRQTIARFNDDPAAKDWTVGEGVFSLQADEVKRLVLSTHETNVLRAYHDLCDLGRYWAAPQPSRQLIYSTRHTCPEIAAFPKLLQHLDRFRIILEARRETLSGSNGWWHLHWPRDERLWQVNKIVALQMAVRPSFVPTFRPTYVSFSANVFVPAATIREDLRYLCALLNSRVLWAWFIQHAKRRGIGLEINGHILGKTPIRRIDFENSHDVGLHNDLIALVDDRLRVERLRMKNTSAESHEIADEIQKLESKIEFLVSSLYRLEPAEIELLNDIIQQ